MRVSSSVESLVKILALEFSTAWRSVALLENGTMQTLEEPPPNRRPAFDLIAGLLRGLNPGEIDRLALNLGPGSYTGVRLGISIAQGWAFARPVSITAFNTFEILVKQLREAGRTGMVHLVLDAQRNEFLVASYRLFTDRAVEVEPCRILSRPDTAARGEAGELLMGPGITRWFPGGEELYPKAATLARLALTSDRIFPAGEIEPFYGREVTFVKSVKPGGCD